LSGRTTATPCALTRRAWLATLAGTLAGADRALAAVVSPRVVALDWGWAETLIAIGHPPIAIVERSGYQNLVVAPPLPDSTLDLGVHTEPSLERLHRIKPDLIVSTPALESLRHLVEPIAPVLSLGIFPAPSGALQRAREQTLALAGAIGIEDAARSYLDRTEIELARLRADLCRKPAPVFVVRIVDARHAVVFGRNSLFQGILDALGLENAWQASTNAYGTQSIGLEKLASSPHAMLVSISSGGAGAVSPPDGPFWRSLPFVQNNRVAALPAIWGFGAVPSAMRFARLLAAQLSRCRYD